MQTKSNRVLVIGGGPAGMMAALFAQRGGADTVLLEKNEKTGKKLYITGKGRCNLCNACDFDTLLSSVPRNPRFLYAAFRFLPPEKLVEEIERLGCPTKMERGQRVYPVSDKASDVTRALMHGLADTDIRCNTAVAALNAEGGRVQGVTLADGTFLPASAVIVATGGLSYPVTGSTGDGYRFAEQTGHGIEACRPSLVPVNIKEDWVRELTGLSLKNVTLTLFENGRKKYARQGEMLFTHFGISGPLVLSMSAHIDSQSGIGIEIDMKPALTEETLDVRLARDLAEQSRKRIATVMAGYLPAAMAALFPVLAEIDPDKPAGQITAKERRAIARLLKHLPLSYAGLRPYTEAVVTRGGVNVKDIDPSRMASKKVQGLYFAGEVLDVDGYTGGFNLQIAFSTGALAGASAASFLQQTKEDTACTI